MQAPQLIYILVSLVLWSYWISKAENKWFLAAILFWLFSLPILEDPRYVISLPFAGFDLQSSRILFLFLSATLFFFIFRAWIEGRSLIEYTVRRFRFYELWMAIFISIALVIIVLNIRELGARPAIVIAVKLLTFLLIYSFARECISPHDFHLLAVAIVTFAILSSLVGIYQFFGDVNFFRIGVTRAAFGSFFRGNGLFDSEYDQGLFLTIALIIGLITIQAKWVKTLIVTIIPVGVFCTMHRGSWAILLIALGFILMREFRKIYPWILSGAIIVILALLVVVNLPLQRNYPGSFLDQMINQRVEDNTLDVRMTLNEYAIKMIQKYPLGIGAYSSSIYIQEAYNNSIDFVEGSPLIVHNGFLAIGVLYGIAGMGAFALFMLTTLIHYLQKNIRSTKIGFVAALVVISFLLINMTQDLSFMGEKSGLFLGLLIGSAISLNSYSENPDHVRSITS
jgi:O-antigen ligase